MKTLVTITAISAALVTATVTFTQPPKKPIAQIQQATTTCPAGSLSVTFPQISGQGCEVYSGFHCLTGMGGGRYIRGGFGGNRPNAQIIYYDSFPNAGLDIFNVDRWQMGLAASYEGPSRGVLQLKFSKYGSGWPGSVTVQ